jgi:pimeloyl-ACP methyl ester carboxylesterase
MDVETTRRGVLRLGAAGATAMVLPAHAAQTAPWDDEGHVDRAGGRLHWARAGSGTPVVLLHKLGGWIADWRGVVPTLAKRRALVAFDLPGHGQSRMHGGPPYLQSVPETATMLLAALDELGLTRVALVGSSLGGCVAIAMAAIDPARVSQLALVSVSLAGRMSRQLLAAQDAAMPPGTYTATGEPLPRTAEQMARFGTFDRAVLDEQNESRAAAGRWVRPSERGVGAMGVVDYLPRVAAPTLLVYGARGHYLQYEEIGRRLLNDVRVEHIADAGSFVQQEQPAATAAVLDSFLAV